MSRRDRPCSHSCSVRFEICSLRAASLWEKSFFFLHSYSRSPRLLNRDARLRLRAICERGRQLMAATEVIVSTDMNLPFTYVIHVYRHLAQPRIVVINSGNVFGTSSETTSKVSANPKTASLNDSSRVISRPRRRYPTASGDSPECCDFLLCECGAHKRLRVPVQCRADYGRRPRCGIGRPMCG